ncbi:MAG: pilus assembly protein TadG-related protein [Chloroflexota bacterium]
MRLSRRWGASDDGQAIIVVALAATVLVASLAFGIDWGYAMAERRAIQNLADTAALGAGKYLASSVIKVNGSVAFSVSQEQTWCTASGYINPVSQKSSFAPRSTSNQFNLYYGDGGSPTVWTTSANTCTANTDVPPTTIYVRVVASVTFSSLVAAIVGHTSSTAGASARVRLSGTSISLTGGPMWAMVRHYNASDFNNTCTTSPCDPTDPTQVVPKTFWDPNDSNVAYGTFKGLIDFSHYSPSFNTQLSIQTQQLITQGDSWAHSPNPLALDQSGGCTVWGQDAQGNKLWDSWGEADANKDKQCSIDNWVYYGYRGTLALDSQWNPVPAGWAGQEVPSTLTDRSICHPAPDPAPSCANRTIGDWVETAGGQVANLSTVLSAAVAFRGSALMPFSNKLVPGTSTYFGKGMVILVYLWDCGEKFNKNGAAGDRWSLIVPGGSNPDCSQLNSAPDRVHLFTVAPFTVYEGTISSNSVKGYWGGLFGSPDSCQSCTLNALANTAVLVPDN